MSVLIRHKKILSLVLIFSFTTLTVGFSPAHARMISTAQILASQLDSERERLNAFLEREDVQMQLEAWGLDKEMAKVRVNSLTDEEVSRMAQQLDQLPAGGGALGVVVGAAILIFLVLLVTDILGYTDVFSFTK
ncbi:PA2779 family protein [Thermodesulfobacteriota bacterium]